MPPETHPVEDLLREVSTYLTDAMLLLVAIFLIPAAILLLGAPVALIIRLAVAMAHRW